MRDVAIIGTGMTRFGELWDSSLRSMFAEAALEALDNAKVDHRIDVYRYIVTRDDILTGHIHNNGT